MRAVGEVLKFAIGRLRPRLAGGEHLFRPGSEFEWNTSGLATPSSHAIIAFGAAWILGRLFPQARLIWLGLATGCAVTRVLQGSHFLSDVYLSAVVSRGVVTLLWRWQGEAPPA
ncbi:phosphatase PAP2 family protein [bacterium]|nr:phosphatase PAP2 family protein [bacterium]